MSVGVDIVSSIILSVSMSALCFHCSNNKKLAWLAQRPSK